ncbi:MAG: molybdopterin molybdotransferase MoeA [Firmicutes bacterium]|nr:molybdopterin molybdotransferase MoeA [Bacillota bacterium]
MANCKDKMQIDKCLEILLEHVNTKIDMEEVALMDAVGRVLGRDIVADTNVPSFAKSAMDGYAVVSSDVASASAASPVRLQVIGQLCAGEYKDFDYTKAHAEESSATGKALRVMTGAMVPEGFDAVVRQEDTDYGMDFVSIRSSVDKFQNYCHVGEDIKKGTVVLDRGTVVLPVHIGILASLGIDKVPVLTPLKIAIISTGDELVLPGERLDNGKIYGSIAFMLGATIRKEGLQVVSMELCRDHVKQAVSLLDEAVKAADVIITTGALSVGKKDFMPEALKTAGAETLFRNADIQPGTPTMASLLCGKPVLSLSGNPYAALANFEIYFWDLAAKLMGSDNLRPRIETLPMAEDYSKKNKSRRLVRAFAKEGKVYLPAKEHQASLIYNLTKCNCLIEFEAGKTVSKGDKVKVRFIKGAE